MQLNHFYNQPFYEQTYSRESYTNLNCPAHCHFDIEVVLVHKGDITVTRNEELYHVHQQEAMLLMPFESHKFITEASSEVTVLTISPFLFPEYQTQLENKSPLSPVTALPEEEYRALCRYIQQLNPCTPFAVKAVFYMLFHLFKENSLFVPAKSIPDTLLQKAIVYVTVHFQEKITLRQLAQELHVSYVYLSRVFNRTAGISFSQLVNSFRFEHAIRLLKNTHLPISDVAFSSGWGSIRSFNRVFHETLGCTPGEFRRRLGGQNEWRYYDIPQVENLEQNAAQPLE